MTYVLVNFKKETVQEFIAKGYKIFTKDAWQRAENRINNFKEESHLIYCFGRKNNISWYSRQELIDSLNIKNITENTMLKYKKNTGMKSGIFPGFSQIIEYEKD